MPPDLDTFIDALAEEVWMLGVKACAHEIDEPRFVAAASKAKVLSDALDRVADGPNTRVKDRNAELLAARQFEWIALALNKLANADGAVRVRARGHRPPLHMALSRRPVERPIDLTPPPLSVSDDDRRAAEADRDARLSLIRQQAEAERARLLEDRRQQAEGLPLWP